MKHLGSRAGLVLAAICVLALALLSGCGSDDESTAQTTSGGGDSTEIAATDGVAAAEEVVREAEEPPTQIGVSQPLQQPPAAGKTFVYLECDIAQCQSIGDAIKKATDVVGWNYVEIGFEQADPSTLIAGMKEALGKDPVAVSFSGQPEALWSQMIGAYEKAGVAIIPQYVGPLELKGPVIGNIDGPADLEKSAEILANWLIADSGGSAKALVQDVPGFPAIATWAQALQETVGELCSECEVQKAETSVAQLTAGSGTSVVVSALQREPSIEYALAFNGLFIPGLESALNNAGRSEVKIAGYVGSNEYVASMLKGNDYAFLGLNTDYGGWLAVDMALRYDQEVELDPAEELLPIQLLTQKSATPEDAKTVTDFQRPEGYEKQFERLWKGQ